MFLLYNSWKSPKELFHNNRGTVRLRAPWWSLDVGSHIDGVRSTDSVPSVNPKIRRWPVCRRLCRSWSEQRELRFPERPAGHSCTKAPFSPAVKSCGHHTGAFHGRAAHPHSLFYYPHACCECRQPSPASLCHAPSCIIRIILHRFSCIVS